MKNNAFNKMLSRSMLLSWKRQFGPHVRCPACSEHIGFCKLCGGSGKVIQEDIDAWRNPISKFMREKHDA